MHETILPAIPPRSKGEALRRRLAQPGTLPAIGIYDTFSATLAAREFDTLFVSGYGFSASHYGLPDAGFIAWPHILDFVQRLSGLLPAHHLVVDIDDGYVDTAVACHVVQSLERLGASAVVLEDQQRPRRCGHVGGKLIMPLDDYLRKLEAVLAARRDILVVARTDASGEDEIRRRLQAFRAAGCDLVLADGLPSLDTLSTIRTWVDCPVVFNQIAGGKSPLCDLDQLAARGVGMAIYSTPCLFAAQTAMQTALRGLKETRGSLAQAAGRDAALADCQRVLEENHQWAARGTGGRA